MLSLQSFLREGRVVGLCWAQLKPKGPNGELNAVRKHKCFLCSPFYVKGVSLGYVGLNENLKDLKTHQSERKHGLYTEQFPVSAYVGISKNLKDLKDQSPNQRRVPRGCVRSASRSS